MSSMTAVKRATTAFFMLHWHGDDPSPPEWKNWKSWVVKGVPPDGNKGGCYAIIKQGKVTYIGLALTEGQKARGGGQTVGLYGRLRRHVLAPDHGNKSKNLHIQGAEEIHLLPFPEQYRYLSASLEAYLIRKCEPSGNYPFRKVND